MPQSEMRGKKKCLVLQGFGEKTDLTDGRRLNLDASYQVIKEAVEEAGLQCLRADEIVHSGLIDVAIYEQILHADLVIADLSTYNLNAAYELGVRYGLKPYATIIVAEEKFKNPFDVSHMTIHYYKHLGEDIGVSEARRFKGELKDAIMGIIDAHKPDSPGLHIIEESASSDGRGKHGGICRSGISSPCCRVSRAKPQGTLQRGT